MSKVLTIKQKILPRVLLYGVLLVFLLAFLPAASKPRQPDPDSEGPYWKTLGMESRHG